MPFVSFVVLQGTKIVMLHIDERIHHYSTAADEYQGGKYHIITAATNRTRQCEEKKDVGCC